MENLFLNKLPVSEIGTKMSDYDLALINAKLFMKKNIHDIDVIPQLRMWFQTLKQPSKTQVDRAIILTIDDDYIIKACGESQSDSYYCSSIRWLQADRNKKHIQSYTLIKPYISMPNQTRRSVWLSR